MTVTEAPALDTNDEIDVSVGTVTSTRPRQVRIRSSLTAETVGRTLASHLSLPAEVPYALRDDDSAEYLDPERPVGDQVQPGARLTVTPKTHLGGTRTG